jgi:dTDP-4-dehydrorhamnose 3,5-epimerase
MIFADTGIPGAYILEPKRIEDERGFFARLLCRNEMSALKLNSEMAQSNIGFSARRGTLRGLHYQERPYEEVKILRCTRGSIYDVVVDLRPESKTWKKWFGMELNEDNRKMLYVPPGCAQGYLTLDDNVEIYYNTSHFYQPAYAKGIRFDDPEFGIIWPIAISIISGQDRQWPDYSSRMRS